MSLIDEEIREAERHLRGSPSPGGYMALRALLRRAGMAEPAYVAAHAEGLSQGRTPRRTAVAAALRAVLRARGVKASVTAPNYSFASSIEVKVLPGNLPGFFSVVIPGDRYDLKALRDQEDRSSDSIGGRACSRLSLSPWNRECRSRPQEDYYEPEGPKIALEAEEQFLAALAQEIVPRGEGPPERGFRRGDQVTFRRKGARRVYVVTRVNQFQGETHRIDLVALTGGVPGSRPTAIDPESLELVARTASDGAIPFQGPREHHNRRTYLRDAPGGRDALKLRSGGGNPPGYVPTQPEAPQGPSSGSL